MALGNFDGFHLGHQAVAGRAIDWARAEGRPAVVATFDPHPMRLFRPDTPPFRLTTLDQRERLFAEAGADAMLLFHFTADLAAKSAEEFVALLVDHLGAAGVVTGEDFTFGKGRSGSVARLKELGAPLGLRAEAVPAVADESGETISSSRIRAALRSGDCATATRLLTRPFAIEGVVQHGDKRGRTIDFHTANIALNSYLRPAYGVYAVRGRLPDFIREAAGRGARLVATPEYCAGLDTRELTDDRVSAWLSADPRTKSVAIKSVSSPSVVYTPAQIRAAYRLPTLPALNSVLTASMAAPGGAGQTIYIVDAYHHPNAVADLAKFNQKFGLPTCTQAAAPTSAARLAAPAANAGCTVMVVYSGTGGTVSRQAPAYDAGWASEIALDVQWAHATAPYARIVLIEAPNASVAALSDAVKLANTLGPGVVSMSFGAIEGSWVGSANAVFQGTGMTYLAATGDSGYAVSWPAVTVVSPVKLLPALVSRTSNLSALPGMLPP